ncbi:MAG: amidohydrolase [Verrucomicrobia bacterium]|nr:amidohydrolase [Verrucomicrobiota bacterium]
MRISILALAAGLTLVPAGSSPAAAEPDLILHHGRVVTVDATFSVRQAIAVAGNRITAVGSDAAILALKGPKTAVVDLGGKMVLPGLIDSHVHPGAAMTEFAHPVPDMETIPDVLSYVRARAQALPPGHWIEVSQVFITRLREQRYPTRAELDQAAPRNPVIFSTGPDASLNSLALTLSGIDRNFQVNDGGAGFVEREPRTGEPTGILRNCTRFVKVRRNGKTPTAEDYYGRTRQLFADYNSVGLTTVCDRDASPAAIARYQTLLARGDLTVRLAISQHIDTLGPIAEVQRRIRAVAASPLRAPNPWLRIIGIKTFLDGGMLTGSAYLRQPWGVSLIYAINDPTYRGVLFIPKDRLRAIVQTTVACGLQFTAHSVGDGAVQTLVEVYDEVNRTRPIRATRPCITHANFMSPEAIARLPQLGVSVDVQPVWLYLDAGTLVKQFGYERLRDFQPWRSVFMAGAISGGGSDHMQKIGSLRSINPYNPFLGMWTAITRRARWYAGQLHPEQALTREQAIRLYTANNAYLLFLDRQVGSLEPGKLADLIVLDTDLLRCPEEAIRHARVLQTYLDGKRVFDRR